MATPLSVDWVVYRSGESASLAADYVPFSSCGEEGIEMEQEVTRVCEAFYSIVSSETLPQGQTARLFWSLETRKGVKALMRVRRVPNPDAASAKRPAAIFSAILLTDKQFTEIGRNPMTVFQDYDRLFDEAIQLRSKGEPERLALPVAKLTASRLPAPDKETQSLWSSGGERVWSVENEQALLRFVANEPSVPSFASWWPPNRPLPPGLFRNVLRAPAPQRTITEELTALADQLADLSDVALQNSSARVSVLQPQLKQCLTSANEHAVEAQQLLSEGLQDQHRMAWADYQREIKSAALAAASELEKGQTYFFRMLPPTLKQQFAELQKNFSEFAISIELERHPGRSANDTPDAGSASISGAGSGTLALLNRGKALIPSSPASSSLASSRGSKLIASKKANAGVEQGRELLNWRVKSIVIAVIVSAAAWLTYTSLTASKKPHAASVSANHSLTPPKSGGQKQSEAEPPLPAGEVANKQNQTLQALKQQEADLTAQVQAANQKASERQAEAQRLKAQAGNSPAPAALQAWNQWKEAKDAAKNKYDEAKAEVRRLEGQFASAERHATANADEAHRLAEKQKELTDLEHASTPADTSQQQNQIDELNRKIKTAWQNIARESDRKKTASEDVKNFQEQLDKVKQESPDAEAKRNLLSEKVDKAKIRDGECQTRITAQRQNIEGFRSEITRLRKAMASPAGNSDKTSRINRLRTEIADLQRPHPVINTDILRVRLTKARGQATEAANRLETLNRREPPRPQADPSRANYETAEGEFHKAQRHATMLKGQLAEITKQRGEKESLLRVLNNGK